MNDQKNIPEGEGADGERDDKIEDIMRARERLDKILQEKFVKRMTIVFTDVSGYTRYMDTRGDIAGRAWMQRHNDIVLPLIEKNMGKVLTLMGDGVMSSFEETEDAVKACIDIQKGLVEYNRTSGPADALHMTIGINTGEILVDSDHIAGDVVNTASRIETKADPDQILISQSTYDEVRDSTEILCRRHGSVQVKGKDEPLELYRVVWQDNDIVASPTQRVRSGDTWSDRRLLDRPSVLQLEITREDSRLKISAFEETEDAVKACIDIQKELVEYNRTSGPADALHVTIGINTGEILVDSDHIAGDAVNTASRIETKADPDQILISQSTYEEVRGSTEILCRRHGSVQVKGKDEPLELYRVVWQDNDIVVSPTQRVRSGDTWSDRRLLDRPSVLQLEITREDSRLKISAFEQEPGEINTVRQYEEIPIPIDKIDNRCHEIVDALNAYNRNNRIDQNLISQLKEMGQTFRDELFTSNIKKKLQVSEAEHLTINLDDQLVQIPWELLHDGKQFLCQRFSMGRLVKTRQTTAGTRSRKLDRPLKTLILADPEENLESARREGMDIHDFMNQRQDLISAAIRTGNITTNLVSSTLKNFDMVHFAGHSEYSRENPAESGWRMSDGVLKAGEFMKMSQSGIMPVLVFSNACQSARTEEWTFETHFHDEIFGLANALILSGVKHYIGTFWEILDEPGRTFALEFYKHVFAGLTVGEAMRRARAALINIYGEESLVWASYLLYGDPTFKYMDQLKNNGARIEANTNQKEPEMVPTVEKKTRDRGTIAASEPPAPKTRSPLIWAGTAGAAIIVVLVIAFFSGIFKPDTTQKEQVLLAYYQNGNFEEALKTAEELTVKNAEVRLSYLVEGDIFLRQGNLEAAREAYEKAVKASKGTDVQKADALIGLGRLASLNNQKDDALNYYEQASEAAPKNSRGYLSQAVLMNQQGDAGTALSLLDKARTLNPDDAALVALTRETRQKTDLAQDEKKQQRIDQLVQELLDSMDQPPRAEAGDGWTSQPLSLWIMDFKTKGYSVQEGEETLLLAGITDQLLETGRVQLVERALLDKLLGELKLSSSELADRRTALAVGKLMAARLIASGTIVYSGPHTQVSLRLFETETGRITASVNETVGSTVPVAELARQLTGNLSDKIGEKYPLRGKIISIEGNTITLNIGATVGVNEKQVFDVINSEIVLEAVAVENERCIVKTESAPDSLKREQKIQAR